jgi:hypothetical protein
VQDASLAGVTARATLSATAKQQLLNQPLGADKKIEIPTSQFLFELPSAQAALLDDNANSLTRFVIVFVTNQDAEVDRTPNSNYLQEKLVRYKGSDRYGDRDAGKGGDDWVKPSVRTVVKHFDGITWGDFSNMNGGPFPPHKTHQTGNDVDAKYANGTYPVRNAATADRMINYLKDSRYGSRIQKVFVTFNAPDTPESKWRTCEGNKPDNSAHGAFWKEIRNVKVPAPGGGTRLATDVIRPIPSHCGHFHWLISD